MILTGTAMAGDGPAEMLRWREPAGAVASGLVPQERVERLGPLPYRGRHDRPEGICRWHDGAWFIVHDNPHPDRVQDRPARVQADLWRF